MNENHNTNDLPKCIPSIIFSAIGMVVTLGYGGFMLFMYHRYGGLLFTPFFILTGWLLQTIFAIASIWAGVHRSNIVTRKNSLYFMLSCATLGMMFSMYFTVTSISELNASLHATSQPGGAMPVWLFSIILLVATTFLTTTVLCLMKQKYKWCRVCALVSAICFFIYSGNYISLLFCIATPGMIFCTLAVFLYADNCLSQKKYNELFENGGITKNGL